MLNALLKLGNQQVLYFLHRFKNEKKKIKYKKKSKQFKPNQNKTFQKIIIHNNKHKAARSPKTYTTIIMLKCLNMNFMHDQILELICKIQKCYRYYNDLFYSCNSKSNKRRRRRTEIKARIRGRKFVNYSKNTSCHCANKLNSGNFKFSNYLRHASIYIQKNFNHLHFIIVTLLLALITTTANSIETQEKTPRNSTSLPPIALEISASAAVIPLKVLNTTDPFYVPCYHIPNALRHDSYMQKHCNSFRYFTHHRHHSHARKLIKMKRYKRIKKYKWFKDDHHRIYKNTNSNIANVNTNLKSNLTKDLKHINEFIKQNNENDYYYSKNINTNDIHLANMHTNEDVSNANNKIELDDDVEVNKLHLTGDLLSPVTTATKTSHKQTIMENIFHVASVDQHHHLYTDQQIDHYKLMKLVMNGLSLQKPPNMKTVNISQHEYATKYQEYLQRVHTRKRREVRDVHGMLDDEYNLRPLQILSILCSSTYEDHDDDMNITIIRRNKREQHDQWNEKLDYSNNDNVAEEHDINKQFKDILFVRKKHQKPRSTKKKRDDRRTNIRLMFALMPQALNLGSDDIEEANVRLVLLHSPTLAIRNHKSKKKKFKHRNNSCGSSKVDVERNTSLINVLNLKVFSISKTGKRTWLDERKVDIHVDLTKPDETHTQWLQFDVTQAVKTTLEDTRLEHIVLELQCENCKRIGARILNDAHNTVADAQFDDPTTEGYQLMPVLNIIGRFGQNKHTMRPHKYDKYVQSNSSDIDETVQRQYHHQVPNNNKNHNRHNRRTNCYKANQRCCRHTMEVTFKEIKGFEFIIQPKVFDAGYCHGRCPPRYNPAHHHAMLQSLIWKQNHQKAPRPCCAPSKLVELEVLHVDEKDNEKLKISTWSDMKVVECACS